MFARPRLTGGPRQKGEDGMVSTGGSTKPFYTGYRSSFIFRLAPGESPGGVAEDHIRLWLKNLSGRNQEIDAWDGDSELSLPGGIEVQEARYSDHGAHFGGRLYRVYVPERIAVEDAGGNLGEGAPGRDHRDQGADERFHRTTLYVFPGEHRGRESAQILIQGATDDEGITQAIDEYEVPSLVDSLLTSRTAFDGDTHITAAPRLVRRKWVKQVADATLDPKRKGAVVVAASPSSESDEPFARVLQSLMRRSVGTAVGFLVAADGVDALNRMLPPHLQVPAGDIRTFLSGVDVDDPESGRQHRYVGPSTLVQSLDENHAVTGFLPTMHARGPRRAALAQALPDELAALRAQVERQARSNRIASAVRRRFLHRNEESAEKGLGAEGQASFDQTFLEGVGTPVTAPLAAEPVDDLNQLLRKVGNEGQAQIPPQEHPQGRSTKASKPVSTAAPRTTARSRTPTRSSAPASASASASVTATAKKAPSAKKASSAKSVPTEPLAVEERPPLDHSVVGVKRVVSFLRRWLYPHRHHDVSEDTMDQKIVEVDEVLVAKNDERQAALELIEEAHDEQQHLLKELSETLQQLEDSRADAALLQAEVHEHAARIAFYRKELIAAKRFDVLNKKVEEEEKWATPKDLHEIVTMLTDGDRGEYIRRFVQFTGDLNKVDQVAQRDSQGHYAADTWRFIRALYDYAQLKLGGESAMNFEMYLKNNEIDGHKVSLKRHAAHESDLVRNREELRRHRMFSVPTSVDPSGKTFMEAHFRVGAGDGFSPRMYYLDNLENDGHIYIGYIGKHPRNSKTN